MELAPTRQVETRRGQPTGQAEAVIGEDELQRIVANFGVEGASARPRG